MLPRRMQRQCTWLRDVKRTTSCRKLPKKNVAEREVVAIKSNRTLETKNSNWKAVDVTVTIMVIVQLNMWRPLQPQLLCVPHNKRRRMIN